MIGAVLVANRGEIARRVFRTCRAMGLRTVAVFSDPDRHSPFVAESDDAIALGGSSPADTYLRGDRIIAAALRTGADAVHPGYGFLAENSDFARAVADAGLVWIGPSPEAIARMGSKLESKRLVEAAGVPTLPIAELTDLSPDGVLAATAHLEYPLLVKASAGGGGKGMRIVREEGDLPDAVAGASREAESAFGDGTVFVEQYLPSPRHVEIQVFGDTHGNLVSLHERECSIQRRHQKIVEEAPSPAVGSELRTRMGAAAVEVARTVDYVGAGTVEFLLDDGEFYFLEMNTRLQVEHAVTEAVTGLDLVQLQLLVAMGEALPPEAVSPRLQGHAIEARLYSEDARRGFLPVTGRLSRFVVPSDPGIRVDSGVETGSEVSVFYDPLLAKIVAHAATRREAALALAGTLQRARIHGTVTNRDLLVRVLRHPEFLAGSIDTSFLERHDAAALAAPLPAAADIAEMALAAALADHDERRAASRVLGSLPSGWRNNPTIPQSVTFEGPDTTVRVGYRFGRSGATVTFDDGEPRDFDYLLDDDLVHLEIEGRRRTYGVARTGPVHDVDGPTGHVSLIEQDRFPSRSPDGVSGSLSAPMPGRVSSVLVAEGQAVSSGQSLVVMEAMKMEHTLRAPGAGVVEKVHAAVGDQVEAGAGLIVIREEPET